MRIVFIIMLFGLMVSPLNARQLVISYVEHPGSVSLQPLIVQSYADIGYEVRYVSMPLTRRLLALERGTIDADLIARSNAAQAYKNILRVGPSLGALRLELVCPLHLPCDQSVLESREKKVFFDRGTASIMKLLIDVNLPYKHSFIESPRILNALFNRHRITYFVHLVFADNHQFSLTRPHQTYVIGEHDMFHYVHRRHAGIINELSVALTRNSGLKHSLPETPPAR